MLLAFRLGMAKRLTSEEAHALVDRAGGNVRAAAASYGVHYHTFRYWLNPEYQKKKVRQRYWKDPDAKNARNREIYWNENGLKRARRLLMNRRVQALRRLANREGAT